MNFSSFSNYIASSLNGNKDLNQGSGEVSDWGIEEPLFPPPSSRSTSVNHQHKYSISSSNASNPPPSYHYQLQSQHHPSSNLQQQLYVDFNPAYIESNTGFPPQFSNLDPARKPTTQDDITAFIKKYLSLHNIQGEFWEKFKYDLIVSDLLDDSMILSKNEQSLKEVTSKIFSRQPTLSREYSKFGIGGGDFVTKLSVLGKKYNLRFPKTNRLSILQCISILYITMKKLKYHQTTNSGRYDQGPYMHAIKLILMVATTLIQHRRVCSLVLVSKASNRLEEFLLNNYKLNKCFMTNLLRIKEDEIFLQTSKRGRNTTTCRVLNHTLSIMTYHLVKSIRILLPHMNAPIFEKYCNVNGVNMSLILQSICEDDSNETETESIVSKLTKKLNTFNQFRKLFICQLLTFDLQHSSNFFLLKICDDFSIKLTGNESRVGRLTKLEILDKVIEEQSKVAEAMINVFEEREIFEDQDLLRMIKPTPQVLQDPKTPVIGTSNEVSPVSPNIDNLIDKLTTITTNIKFFQKYNTSTSTVTDIDELNEKIFIFNKFGQELLSVQELFQVSLNDLCHRVNRGSENSTPSTSKRNSTDVNNQNGGESFNLKTFHTTSSTSNPATSSYSALVTKRYSLPNSRLYTSPISSPIQPPESPRVEKKYKRLSAGLAVGLLTVFEEPGKKGIKPEPMNLSESRRNLNNIANSLNSPLLIEGNGRRNSGEQFQHSQNNISHDDNYVNILPPTSYYNETYNQAALESLSRKNISRIVSGSRYSLNSMNSNVSGISDMIVSTNQTSEPEEQSASFSKEDLKLKLEESFNRIYNLEQKLKQQEQGQPYLHQISTTSATSHNTNIDESETDEIMKADLDIVKKIFKSGFMNQLESTLQRGEADLV